MEKPILTIYCLAYNHGNYIKKTLEGFIRQKTEYKFKVIVHDDASTDDTAKIIKEYADKFPDIISPIFQIENQYSKGVKIVNEFITPRLEGKYIAVCEGDDYWCDENKIQIQIDYMENNQDCALCVHNTEFMNEDGTSMGKFFNKFNEERDFSTDELIRASDGGFFHLSSFLYRLEDRLNYPSEFYIKGVGDYPLTIYLSTKGRVHYIDKVMSKYRVMSKGSWTQRINSSKKSKKKHLESMIAGIKAMDEATDYIYHESFVFAEKNQKFAYMNKIQKLMGAIFDSDYRRLLKEKLIKKMAKK